MAADEDLIREAELIKALEDADAAYNAAPSGERYAAHNRAQEALFAQRASMAPDPGTIVPETVTLNTAVQEG